MQKTPLTLAECQSISLDILTYFDAFCREHGLRYYLAYGTLLGAIRHGGFIPWDDDIDLIMARSDYERMISIFSDEQKRYRCISFEQGTFYLPFAKIVDTRTEQFPDHTKPYDGLGVGIDIFPFDSFSGTREQVLKKKKKATALLRSIRYTLYPGLRSLNEGGFLPIHSLYYLYCKLFGTAFFSRKLRRYIRRISSTEGQYVGLAAALDSDAYCVYDSSIFDRYAEYSFEGHAFFSFADYDRFLSTAYGDYMTPPKEENRTPHFAASYMKDE